jgi:hypothetical protein
MRKSTQSLFEAAGNLPSATQAAIWDKLTTERGNRDPFRFDDPAHGVAALALLRDKVLEDPDAWSSEDWKFVFFYAFQGCLEQPSARADACAVFARICAELPTRDGTFAKSFLEELEKGVTLRPTRCAPSSPTSRIGSPAMSCWRS